MGKTKTLTYIAAMLICIQVLLFGLSHLSFLFVERTDYSDHMASMFSMIFITISFLVFARKKSISLSILPERFGKSYIIGTLVSVALLVATPSNYTGGFQPIWLLIYSSIVTPVFEEVIFRGYVWNKLNTVFEKEWVTYIVSTVFFALWHIGYVDSIAFRIETGLVNALLWKVITGLCFGIVLGVVRIKTKNGYSTILWHGVMNIFGR